jgi:hypothetical protein
LGPGPGAAKQGKPEPTSLAPFIPSDVCAALVIHPGRMSDSPLAAMWLGPYAKSMVVGTNKVLEWFAPKKIRRVTVLQVNQVDQQILLRAAALQQLWNQGAIAEANLVRLQVEGQRLGVEFVLKDRAFAKQEAQLNRTDPKKKKLPSAPPKHLEQTFAEYDDFNYLREKQRLLDSLQPAR